MKRGFCVSARSSTKEQPSRQVLRGQAATSRSNVTFRIERLVEHTNTCLDHPGLCRQISAGGTITEQSHLREQQSPRALRANQLSRRIQFDAFEELCVPGDLARP